VIVIKNNALGMIQWEQMVQDGNPQFGVDLYPIDFAKVAEACGVAGYTIELPDQAEPILRRALQAEGPVVVQCVVDPQEPPLPGNITTKQARKFAEALLKDEKHRSKIIKTLLQDKVREVV
jgi:pyruvate dehydrogenase (quinone)